MRGETGGILRKAGEGVNHSLSQCSYRLLVFSEDYWEGVHLVEEPAVRLLKAIRDGCIRRGADQSITIPKRVGGV